MQVGLFLSWSFAKRLGRLLSPLGKLFTPFIPDLSRELELTELKATDAEYLVMSVFNAFLYALFLLIIISVLLFWRSGVLFFSLDAVYPSIAAFALLFLFFVFYPRIMLGKLNERVDRDLVFALKDLSAQMASGVSLYDAMESISKGGYGLVSSEFELVVKDINAGAPEEDALSKMIDRTESPYIKKTIWQMVSVLRSGASIQGALSSIVDSLNQQQGDRITSYVQEVNLWVLIYLIIAVAIPSLGATLLVILSSISGTSVSGFSFILLLTACFLAQFVLIKYIKVRRPIVHM